MGRFPAIIRAKSASVLAVFPDTMKIGTSVRQGGCQHADTQNSENRPQAIESLECNTQASLEGRRLKGLDARKNPDGGNTEYSPYDGHEDEASTPIEDAGGNTADNTPQGKTKWVPGREAGKCPVLTL